MAFLGMRPRFVDLDVFLEFWRFLLSFFCRFFVVAPEFLVLGIRCKVVQASVFIFFLLRGSLVVFLCGLLHRFCFRNAFMFHDICWSKDSKDILTWSFFFRIPGFVIVDL